MILIKVNRFRFYLLPISQNLQINMSEVEPLYCAEQIKVPPAMPEILKAWTKAVIRENVSQVSTIYVVVVGDGCILFYKKSLSFLITTV